MDKAGAKIKVHELVDYMLNTLISDEDLIKHYDDMMWELVEQYAQQVSRGIAVEFELRHVYKGASKSAKRLAYMQFDEWKSNHKESNENKNNKTHTR